MSLRVDRSGMQAVVQFWDKDVLRQTWVPGDQDYSAVMWAAAYIEQLEFELDRFVRVEDPFETFKAGDGLPAIRVRDDLYERKGAP